MLFEPERTSFDLSWRMFGVPVRVHPWFWLSSAILGWSWEELGFQYLLAWMVCVFVSILIHELGHVFMGRLFGSYGHIVLYAFGGLAIGSSQLPKRWQRIAVYLAGPAAQLLLYALVILIEWLFLTRGLQWISSTDMRLKVLVVLGQLAMINLAWPILNLLPIWPLDGGQTSREIFDWFLPGKGLRVSLQFSLATAAALAIYSLACEYSGWRISYLLRGDTYTAILFGVLALNNYLQLQQTPQHEAWQQRRDPWQQDADSWKR